MISRHKYYYSDHIYLLILRLLTDLNVGILVEISSETENISKSNKNLKIIRTKWILHNHLG